MCTPPRLPTEKTATSERWGGPFVRGDGWMMIPITLDPDRHPHPEAPKVRIGPAWIDDDASIRLIDDVSLAEICGRAVVMIVRAHVQEDRPSTVRQTNT